MTWHISQHSQGEERILLYLCNAANTVQISTKLADIQPMDVLHEYNHHRHLYLSKRLAERY